MAAVELGSAKKRGVEKNKEMKSSLFGDFREKKTKKKKIVGVVVVVVCEIGGIVWEKKAKNSVKKQKQGSVFLSSLLSLFFSCGL